MKIIKIKGICILLVISNFLLSCIEHSFTIPDIVIKEPEIHTELTIHKVQKDLMQEFRANGKLTYTYPIRKEPTYVIGYVISNDNEGNFYKKLIIQDRPTNPNAGLEVRVNSSSLNQVYEVGRKVYLKLDGLTVTYDDGQPLNSINPTNSIPGKFTLGLLNYMGRLEAIPSTSYRDYIVRSSVVEAIKPTTIRLRQIEEKYINTFVSLEGIQFEKQQLGKTFSGEVNDQYDGFRALLECETGNSIFLQTSTFASFKSNRLPSKSGKINAVLSKDFGADFFVLLVNTPSDLDFVELNRCDPTVLACDSEGTNAGIVIYEENFENRNSITDLEVEGWRNVNVNGGDNLFALNKSNGNNSVQLGAFRSGENPMEVWLVSPPINLDASINESLSFDTLTGYNNGEALSIWVAADFTGDIESATWLHIEDAKLADGPVSGYQTNFTNSGSVDVSCLSGNIHLAFRYLGGDGTVTTTFRIDNVKFTGGE
ncbi:DUF5689 domain-containing protein [Tenacibaculum maritimum]|uniref:DUF5689 domain-containing protein n=1 Tax=Tenacibaculum maritimum TaxID=107401 RepID=UPI0012E4AA9F|nr:DUF5689 domain-containing protein [Tenacibaculum maritimum]CAA0151003.1 conserved hypothetical protein [Tenacibaculum maritimum]